MEQIIQIILMSGKSAIDLALYVLLPVMVVMMGLMKLVEAKGGLNLAARLLSPPLRVFGIPGAGVFAILQLMLVSFAAPAATLALMERDGTGRRHIAATLAMVLAMSQANVVFPLVAAGLNLTAIVLSSLAGGFAAAALTYYLFARSFGQKSVEADTGSVPDCAPAQRTTALNLLILGGQEAMKLVAASVPIIILAICLVNALKITGAIGLLETLLAPVLGALGLPAVAVLPIATKFLAGGTAMMGVCLNLLQGGTLSVAELNRIAGFLIHPLDIVGVAVLCSAGARCASVVRPAMAGAAGGLLLRAAIHLTIF